jgi:FKBP-type peptidyl-prolyl cis-trans isomerase
MKLTIVAVIGLAVAVTSTLAVGQDTPAAPSGLKDLKAQVSYGLGMSLGQNLKRQANDLDPDLLAKGLKDAFSGAKPLMTDQQIKAYTAQMQALQGEASKGLAEKNKTEGAAFLAANKKKPGVVTLPSGLQYKVIKEGTGKSPKATDTVSTHYTGTLLDGTKFDSSVDRGQPASFPVNGVIAGWTEALQKMKVGSKWQLFIPAELAYGANPRAGGPIGPNAVLVFDIELLGIQ